MEGVVLRSDAELLGPACPLCPTDHNNQPRSTQGAARAPLHCAVTVRLGLQQDAGVASAPNQIEIARPGHHQRAALPLEAEIVVAPTLQVTNALPYQMEVCLVALAQQAGDAEDAAAAAALGAALASGASAPPPGAVGGDASAGVGHAAGRVGAAVMRGRVPSLSAAGGGAAGAATPDNALSPSESLTLDAASVGGAARRPSGTAGGGASSGMRPAGADAPVSGLLASPLPTAVSAGASATAAPLRGPSQGRRGGRAWAGRGAGVGAAPRNSEPGAAGWARLTQMVQERWLRDLIFSELLATLPALSQQRRRALDAPLAALMSYPQLVALALGMLLDDLRWIMRAFPRELAVGFGCSWWGQGADA
jgi:hypothetical protein